MRNKTIIESILCLLKSYKSASSSKFDKGSFYYLLGQTIRQYDIPEANRHVSQKAKQRWDLLSTDDIMNYHYRNWVVCDKLTESVKFGVFSGAKKIGIEKQFNKGDKFRFRELFHEDHVIPVSLILKEMIDNTPAKYEDIENLLNKMHVCVILKEEDRELGRTKGRTLDFKKTIDTLYKENDIVLLP